jgi:hypothetical protein
MDVNEKKLEEQKCGYQNVVRGPPIAARLMETEAGRRIKLKARGKSR